MKIAEGTPHSPSYIYGDGNTSEKMIKILKEQFGHGTVIPKKRFYNIDFLET